MALGLCQAPGTVVQLGTIEQPVNLGAKADPGRIPLGPVAVESNHGYDVHAVITEPRACTHGSLVLEKGLELNMNLASVFGMLVDPEDGTQVPRRPVTIRVNDWPRPAYSPYTKEQVLAATIHCLLRSVHATPEQPLVLKLDARNPEDAKNLGAFAGTYITAETKHPSPVPGTSLETDWRGVTSVVFDDPGADPAPVPRRPPPALVPVRLEDGTDESLYALLPVWAGDNWRPDPRDLLGSPIPLFYDRFDRSTGHGPDINALTNLGIVSYSNWVSELDQDRFVIHLSADDEQAPKRLVETLSAACHCLVLTCRPAKARPLVIQMQVSSNLLGPLSPFTECEGWSVSPLPKTDGFLLECRFARNPDSSLLADGAIPLGHPRRPELHRGWTIFFDQPPRS